MTVYPGPGGGAYGLKKLEDTQVGPPVPALVYEPTTSLSNSTVLLGRGAGSMRKAIMIVTVLCLTGLVHAQEQRPPREVWNEVFTQRQGREFPHNKFLAETIRGRKPGKALDIGMGEGRNAIFLATNGWEVTGFDISDVGVRLAREAAQKKGLKVETLVDDADRFDYGTQRWDMVVGMYMHGVITRTRRRSSTR